MLTWRAMDSAPSVAQHDKCMLTELADGTGVLLHLETKFYYTLNPTGVEVWKALGSGAKTEREVAEKISQEFEVDVDTASTDVGGVLAMMLSEGLVRKTG
jgi:Coenzyme PQQ synthesis protein D (PqqD)